MPRRSRKKKRLVFQNDDGKSSFETSPRVLSCSSSTTGTCHIYVTSRKEEQAKKKHERRWKEKNSKSPKIEKKIAMHVLRGKKISSSTRAFSLPAFYPLLSLGSVLRTLFNRSERS